VLEVFMETKIPIIEDAPFFKELSFEGAYRFSRYSSGIEADTYKLAGNWSPTEDFRLRGAYQRAIRAPNIIELFASSGLGLFNMTQDPCDDEADGDDTNNNIPASCIGPNPWQVSVAQSDTGALFSPAGQYNQLFGGNTDLEAETADTWTYGVVLTPTFLPGFIASVDYFDIEVIDLITAIAPEQILNVCYASGVLCGQINRDSFGTLWRGSDGFVDSRNTNIGGLSTTGIDINAYYRTEIDEGWGAVSFNLVATWLDELVTDDGLGATNAAGHTISVYDCVGFYGSNCGTPNPEWRHRFRVSWELPVEGWNPIVSVTWRRFSEVRLFNAAPITFGHGNHSVCPADPTGAGCPDRLSEVFDAQNYIDVGFSADIMTGTSFRFGINNVFDKDPPLSGLVGAGFGNGNTYPAVYDALGRYVFAGVTINL
jgi:outer membrane receptor protein involved in Fe transport